MEGGIRRRPRRLGVLIFQVFSHYTYSWHGIRKFFLFTFTPPGMSLLYFYFEHAMPSPGRKKYTTGAMLKFLRILSE
jgi:hypothetical protein